MVTRKVFLCGNDAQSRIYVFFFLIFPLVCESRGWISASYETIWLVGGREIKHFNLSRLRWDGKTTGHALTQAWITSHAETWAHRKLPHQEKCQLPSSFEGHILTWWHMRARRGETHTRTYLRVLCVTEKRAEDLPTLHGNGTSLSAW